VSERGILIPYKAISSTEAVFRLCIWRYDDTETMDEVLNGIVGQSG